MKNAQGRIYLDALRQNALNALNDSKNGVIAIVKNDAYHFGLIPCIKVFYEAGIRAFATTSLRDAIRIRKEFDSRLKKDGEDIDIILLNQVNEFDILREYDISPTLPSLEYIKEYKEDMKGIKWHLEWAGQMRRSGATSEEELIEIISFAKEHDILLEGIWTHFAWADEFDENHSYEAEREKWLYILKKAKSMYEFKYIHAQNTASFMRDGKLEGHSHVRIGIYLYGCPSYPDAPKEKLTHALDLYGYVITVNTLRPGESIGYSASFRAEKEEKVAVINLGYGDGILRKRAYKNEVEINSKRYPLVSIMMSHTVAVVDENVKKGDKVYFYSKTIPLDEFAKKGVGTASEQVTALDFSTIELEYVK